MSYISFKHDIDFSEENLGQSTTEEIPTFLTLARTCYFAILERTWGGGAGCHPQAISLLIVTRASGQRPADCCGTF